MSDKVVGEGLPPEVTPEQRLGANGGGSHVDIWSIPGKETDRREARPLLAWV